MRLRNASSWRTSNTGCVTANSAPASTFHANRDSSRSWSPAPGFTPTPIAHFVAPPSGLLRSEEHTSELQSLAYLVCRLLLEKKNKQASLRARLGIHAPVFQTDQWFLNTIRCNVASDVLERAKRLDARSDPTGLPARSDLCVN